MLRISISVALVLAVAGMAVAAAQSAGDPVAGKKAFDARCGTCHSINPALKKIGPHLKGVVGRKAGAVAGFRYSEALKKSRLTFDMPTLNAYVTNPRKTVPGAAMVIGVPDAKVRADIIAYLGQQK